MGMMNPPTVSAASTGRGTSRTLKSWFSQVERQKLRTLPSVPVMANPPQATLTKATGMSAVAIQTAGTGYVAGETVGVDGGTFVTAARIRILTVGSNGEVLTAAVSTSGVYTAGATPANPASVTGGSGTGAKFTLTWNSSAASSIFNGKTWNRTDASAYLWTGSDVRDVVSGYRGNGTGNGTQCTVEFYSEAPLLDFRFVGSLSYYDLYIDGQRVAATSLTTDTSGQPYLYTIDWNGESKPRHYKLMGINTSFGGVITDNKYSVWAPSGVRPLVWVLGDSYTYGTMSTQGSFNDIRQIGDILDVDTLADGIGGSGWTSSADTTIPQNRIAQKYTTLSRTPQYVLLNLGYNDAAAGRVDLLKTNFRATVAGILAKTPLVKIIVIGPATPLGSVTTINVIRTAMMELCAEYGFPFVDVADWVNANNKQLYTAADNTHPTDAGYAFRAARMALALQDIL